MAQEKLPITTELEKLLDAIVPIATEWEVFTPVLTNFGTVTNVTFRKRRDGADMLIRGSWTSGVIPGAGVASLGIPDGLTGDSVGGFGAGDWTQAEGSTSDFKSGMLRIVGSSVQFTDSNSLVGSSGNPHSAANAIIMFDDSLNMGLNLRMPITTWNATQTLREQLGLV